MLGSLQCYRNRVRGLTRETLVLVERYGQTVSFRSELKRENRLGSSHPPSLCLTFASGQGQGGKERLSKVIFSFDLTHQPYIRSSRLKV